MTTTSAIDAEFKRFAQRFVRCYWEEIARGAPEFASHSEPCKQTPEELLQEIDYDASCERAEGESVCDGTCVLRMVGAGGDAWRFTFRQGNAKWLLVAATSGSKQDEARVDLLDEVYAQWFRPFLERIIDSASGER